MLFNSLFSAPTPVLIFDFIIYTVYSNCTCSIKRTDFYNTFKKLKLHYMSNTLQSSPLTDSRLTDGQRTITDIGSEVAKLQATYNAAIQSRDEAKKQLAREIGEQQLTKWELEHQKRRTKDYEKQTDKIEMEIAALKSHIPMISESFFFFLLIACVI